MAPSNQSNAQSLEDVPFLRNLAATFHVTSIPLAIFLLILVCLACIGALTVIIICVRSCVRRAVIRKPKRKRMKPMYLDEILNPVFEPGMCGLLTFSMDYEVSTKALNLMISEAKELVTTNDSKSVSAYATVRLAQRSGENWTLFGTRYKTNVQRHTTVPRWNYLCTYTLTENELKNSKVIFEVFDYDSLGQDRSVGRADIILEEIDMDEYVGCSYEKTVALKSGTDIYRGIGELCIGLAFLPNPGCIEAFIYEARKLDINHMISPGKDLIYIQAKLKYKKRTLGTYETKMKVDTLNPYFNEKAVFTLKPKYLDEAYVVCQLKKRGTAGGRSTIARAVVGPQSPLTTGVKQWDEMKRNSPRTHVMWHVLIPHGTQIDP